jgi:hypothetical protein
MGNNPEVDALKKELINLKNFKVKESEIKKNVEYYKNNLKQFKKINTIIENAKKGGVFEFSPIEAYKIYGGEDIENRLELPNKWKDLFKLECSEGCIDKLFNMSQNHEKTKEKMEKCKTIMELKNKCFNNWTPYGIYYQTYKYTHFDDKWENIYFEKEILFLNKLLEAMNLIDLINYFDKKKSDGNAIQFWYSKINFNNYQEYKEERETYEKNEEKLKHANKIFKSIRYKSSYINEDERNLFSEFEKADLKYNSKPEKIDYFLEELKKAKKRILKAKKEDEEEDEKESKS